MFRVLCVLFLLHVLSVSATYYNESTIKLPQGRTLIHQGTSLEISQNATRLQHPLIGGLDLRIPQEAEPRKLKLFKIYKKIKKLNPIKKKKVIRFVTKKLPKYFKKLTKKPKKKKKKKFGFGKKKKKRGKKKKKKRGKGKNCVSFKLLKDIDSVFKEEDHDDSDYEYDEDDDEDEDEYDRSYSRESGENDIHLHPVLPIPAYPVIHQYRRTEVQNPPNTRTTRKAPPLLQRFLLKIIKTSSSHSVPPKVSGVLKMSNQSSPHTTQLKQLSTTYWIRKKPEPHFHPMKVRVIPVHENTWDPAPPMKSFDRFGVAKTRLETVQPAAYAKTYYRAPGQHQLGPQEFAPKLYSSRYSRQFLGNKTKTT